MGQAHRSPPLLFWPVPLPSAIRCVVIWMGLWSKWWKGVLSLPDWYLLRVKMIFSVGLCVGIVFAGFFLVRAGYWYGLGILGFALALQLLDLVVTGRQYSVMRSFGKEKLGRPSAELARAISVAKGEDANEKGV